MEAAPDLRTIKFFLDGDETEAHPQSKTMDAHNKGQRDSLQVTQTPKLKTSRSDSCRTRTKIGELHSREPTH